MITNETIEDRYIFECRGWSEDGSRDLEQKAWQIATSVYMAVILLVAVAALPLHACEKLVVERCVAYTCELRTCSNESVRFESQLYAWRTALPIALLM